ncbi:hypothetical protein Syun_027305 [Stephania yunnanensis]|uniref:Uncharacterized protein n=1 Tax=Stephania yunnanensis TaxID=152371 RepID=A0AAP0EP80_9MAGN
MRGRREREKKKQKVTEREKPPGKRTDDRRRRAGGVAARRLTAQAPADDGRRGSNGGAAADASNCWNWNRLADQPRAAVGSSDRRRSARVAAAIGSDAGEQLCRRGSEGARKRAGSAATARERDATRMNSPAVADGGTGERPAGAPASDRRRRRRGSSADGAVAQFRSVDEIATTRWRDLRVGCRVRKSRRETF